VDLLVKKHGGDAFVEYGLAPCCKYDPDTAELLLDKDPGFEVVPFYFDSICGPESSQEELYDEAVRDLVDDVCLSGYSGTVMTYGQSGSGKSYSLFGDDEEPGVMHLAVSEVFRSLSTLRSQGRWVSVTASFLEIYNEQITDLLVGVVSFSEAVSGRGGGSGNAGSNTHKHQQHGNRRKYLEIRENESGPVVEGLTWVWVKVSKQQGISD
jgi:hypothetical protein